MVTRHDTMNRYNEHFSFVFIQCSLFVHWRILYKYIMAISVDFGNTQSRGDIICLVLK